MPLLRQVAGAEPEVMRLDDPTRGVDVGVRAEMHRVVRRLAEDGLLMSYPETGDVSR